MLEPIEEPVAKGKKEEEVDEEDTDPVYAHSFLEAVESRMNRYLNLSRYEKGSTVADGITWEEPEQQDIIPLDTLFHNVSLFSEALGRSYDDDDNITVEANEAMITLTAEAAENSRAILRDAYEVAVYVDRMADCLQGFISLLQAQASNSALRFSPLFHFVGKEEALLSASHDQPVLWVSFADVVYYNQK